MQDPTPPAGQPPAAQGPADSDAPHTEACPPEGEAADRPDAPEPAGEPQAQEGEQAAGGGGGRDEDRAGAGQQAEPGKDSPPAEPSPDAAPAEQAPDAAPAEGARKAKGPAAVVRFGRMGHVGEFRCNLDRPPAPGTKVVVRTGRGVELGTVVIAIGESSGPQCLARSRLDEFLDASGPDYPFDTGGRILRVANAQDVIDDRHLAESAQEEATFCREQIKDLGLVMRLVAVEHLLGGERIVLYFTAESRVDFRELVRRLAAQYRTRIEMRQVGARDEARLVADYERCGLPCCCRRFLKDLRPVSMRMAKSQKATLDPTKISGRCGRLMCCLRYEDACYEELRRQLPKKNVWVRTEELVGRVAETQVLTQLVRLVLADGTTTAVANEDIVERDLEPPPEGPAAPPARQAVEPEKKTVGQAPTGAVGREGGPEEAPAAPADTDVPEGQGPRRSRRPGRKGREAGRSQEAPARQDSDAGGPGRRRSKRSPSSRRRGRRKRSGGSQPSG